MEVIRNVWPFENHLYDGTVIGFMKRSIEDLEKDNRSYSQGALIMKNLRNLNHQQEYIQRSSLYNAVVMRSIKQACHQLQGTSRTIDNAVMRSIKQSCNEIHGTSGRNYNVPEYIKRNSVYGATVLRNMKRYNDDLESEQENYIQDNMFTRNLRSISNLPENEKRNIFYNPTVRSSMKKINSEPEEKNNSNIGNDRSWLPARLIFRSLRSGNNNNQMVTRISKQASDNQVVNKKRNSVYDFTVLQNLKRSGNSIKPMDIYYDVILRSMKDINNKYME